MMFPQDISSTSRLIVAISGGADSIALLDMLVKKDFHHLIIAHVNHHLRKDSAKDAELVRRLAKQYRFPCVIKNVQIKNLAKKKKENIEALARDERYRFFETLRKKLKAKAIVTAHHADDQVETVLINIIRGSGLDGLSGMRVRDRQLWRPLLSLRKHDLRQYCLTNQLRFREDSTNQDLHYRRNFLRQLIIPLIEALNPNFITTMLSNISLWQKAGEALQNQTKNYILRHRSAKNRFLLKPFLKLSEGKQQAVLRAIFEKVHGTKKNIFSGHLAQLIKLLNTNISGKQKEFGKGKTLIRKKEYFEIVP